MEGRQYNPSMSPTSATRRQTEPLFVVGALRSGTTMFRLMLDQHPQISNPGEFEESVHMLGDTGWAPLPAYRDYLRASTQIRAAGFSVAEDLDYPALVHDLWRQVCALSDKPIVGASIHSRFDRCPDLWPKARYLHVVRDPRDVARSCIGMGWAGNVYCGAQIWIDAERRWDRLRQRIDRSQWHEVRYESLVREPEATLREVCEFAGVPYSEAMLDYAEHSSYGRPDPSLVEQWRRRQTPRQVQHVEWRCGELLRARGYTPSEHGPHAPGAAERAYLSVDNRIGKVRAAVERYGLGLWLLDRVTLRAGPAALRHRVDLRKNDIDRSHHK